MTEVFGTIDYQRLARALGRPNKGVKYELELDTARTGITDSTSLLATNGQKVEILSKGDGIFVLIFVFQDGTTLTLLNSELEDGKLIDVDFAYLFIVNEAQSDKDVSLIVYSRVIEGIYGY